jgi:hypothetical protein
MDKRFWEEMPPSTKKNSPRITGRLFNLINVGKPTRCYPSPFTGHGFGFLTNTGKLTNFIKCYSPYQKKTSLVFARLVVPSSNLCFTQAASTSPPYKARLYLTVRASPLRIQHFIYSSHPQKLSSGQKLQTTVQNPLNLITSL